MSDPFAVGTQHGGWRVTALQGGAATPRRAVERDGLQGVLTFYPYAGQRGPMHVELAARGEAWHDAGHDALAPALAERRPDGVVVVQPTLDRVGGQEAVPPEDALAAVRRAAEALAPLHATGVAHGEVDAWSLVKLPSGAAALLPPGLRPPSPGLESMGVWADPRYAAPEVLDGRPATPASDVFSLGLVLYRLATGHVPAAGNDPAEALAARGKVPVPDIQAGKPGLAPAIVELYRCMCAAEDLRPQDAAALLELVTEAERQRPPSVPARPPLSVKPDTVGAPLVLLLLLLAVVAGGVYALDSVLAAEDPAEGTKFQLPE